MNTLRTVTAEMIYKLETQLQEVAKSARNVHHACMGSEEGGNVHPSLALMEMCVRTLSAANDAARYARHSLEFVDLDKLKAQ